jgi:hypothetical protein
MILSEYMDLLLGHVNRPGQFEKKKKKKKVSTPPTSAAGWALSVRVAERESGQNL